MKFIIRFVIRSLLISTMLSACGPSQEELDATSTQVAAYVFATQTAQVPTVTATFTPSPTPTLTPTPTTTPTPTLTPTNTPTPTKTPITNPLLFQDDFMGALGADWLWVADNPDNWNLTSNQGWLEITVSDTTIYLVREVPEGNFELETKLNFKPTGNYEFAGLSIIQGDYTTVTFGRAFCNEPQVCVGDGYYFDSIYNGEFVGTNFATPAAKEAIVYLRLRREGNTYTAYASEDRIDWQLIGTHDSDMQPQYVGLQVGGAVEADPKPAQFDYFTINVFP